MRRYEVQGRNGYWAIDLYENGECRMNIEIFNTRKLATSVANALNKAYRDGIDKAHEEWEK
jgi:hypothetical protein